MSVTHEEVVKAAEAERILNSDVFKEAIENLKNEYITHWLNSRGIDDVAVREDFHRSLSVSYTHLTLPTKRIV